MPTKTAHRPADLRPADRRRDVVRDASGTAILLGAIGLALRARSASIRRPATEGQKRLDAAIAGFLRPHDLEAAIAAAPPAVLDPIRALIRAELFYGANLLADAVPMRGWQNHRPEVLQAFCAVSHGMARLVESFAAFAAPALLQRLGAGDAQFLNIGCGVGWVSIGMMQRWPGLRVTGTDPREAALDLARGNLQDTGLSARMTLRNDHVQMLTEVPCFDMAFVPSAFIPATALPEILIRARRALKPGGLHLMAVIDPPDDALAAAQAQFRAAVWGGDVLGLTGGKTLLRDAGFSRIEQRRQPDGTVGMLLAQA